MNTFLKNFNFRRIIYLAGSLAFFAIAIQDQVWWMGIFGLYFLSIFIFKFGCASGSCGATFELYKKENK